MKTKKKYHLTRKKTSKKYHSKKESKMYISQPFTKKIKEINFSDIDGGKAIASGGFGCVFKPALKCKNEINVKKNYISKLMFNKYANEELKIIKDVNTSVKTIPDYEKFFLIHDIYSCKPDDLSVMDIKNFDLQCRSLVEKGIHRYNLNNNLHRLKIINIPYGGIDIDSYWTKWNISKDSKQKNKAFAITNICMIQLLSKGILKMNLNKFYHLDIKGSNILRTFNGNVNDVSNVKTRVIDWGLSMKYDNLNSKIPDELVNRPLQYNMPFTSILFQSNIQKIINNYLDTIKKSSSIFHSHGKTLIIKGLAAHILETTIVTRGKGHIDVISDILNTIYSPLYAKSKKKLIHTQIIVDYIASALDKYTTDDYIFMVKEYLEEVFLRNVDIWGFLMAYIDLITLKNPWTNTFQSSIVKVFTEYCFDVKYATEYIPVYPIINSLLNLNLTINQPLKFKGYPVFTNKYTKRMRDIKMNKSKSKK